MRENRHPLYQIDDYNTFAELLLLSKRKYGDSIAFRIKSRKAEESKTFIQLYSDVAKLTCFFSAEYGKAKKIAILGENSYWWIVSYFAIVCSSNIVVPIDKELSTQDIYSLLLDCGCSALIYSKSYDDIAEELQHLMGEIECIEDRTLAKFVDKAPDVELPQSDEAAIAAIVYTSGTTGKSKGVMLSQQNLCADTRAACMHIELYGRTLAMLPFHHTFAFTVSVLANIYYGIDTLVCHSLKNVMPLINEFKPNFLVVVPMIVEKVDKGILDKISKSGKKKLLTALNILCKPFDIFSRAVRNRVFSAVRQGLGGELDFIICGGAPIDSQIIKRFMTYGIQILNGYGITECSPVVSVNRYIDNRVGSIGRALPGVCVRIDNPNENGDGELCVQGKIVMHGYYNMPKETETVLNNGWFHTGDIGRIDKDGFIYITGRMKNLIILSNGKNVAPEELEGLIGRIAGVAEVLVYEKNAQLVAEIYPEQEYSTAGKEYFEKAIWQLNDSLPPYKAIAKVLIRDTEFEKTTTKKIKRTREG